jgi:hypothetical protein
VIVQTTHGIDAATCSNPPTQVNGRLALISMILATLTARLVILPTLATTTQLMLNSKQTVSTLKCKPHLCQFLTTPEVTWKADPIYSSMGLLVKQSRGMSAMVGLVIALLNMDILK